MEQIRWKQRFDNLERAFKKLERGLEIFDYDEYLTFFKGKIENCERWKK
ncbi:MAG TPA: hypothetical protein VFM82_11585 [Flavobacteriaceae bacterium]|nr:hypothetical protein [Flavobacteriaceae bacterium]